MQHCRLSAVNLFVHGSFVGYAQIRIDLMQSVDQYRQQAPRVRSGSHRKGEPLILRLAHGEILRRPSLNIKRCLSNIFDFADNLPLCGMPTLVIGDPLADRVLTREILSSQGLVDDGHAGFGSIFGFGEKPAAHQARPERGQILGTHVALDNFIVFDVGWFSRDLD